MYAIGKTGLTVAGTVEELLDKVDVIVDGTPKGCGEENLQQYKRKGVKAILQGGETAACVECSFNAQNNYDEARGKSFVRVVSCNTTALSRVLGGLKRHVRRATVTLLRRAMDPGQKGRTILNSIEPSFQFPSHHGPDVRTILPDLEVFSVAFKVPTTLMHVHAVEIELRAQITTGEAVSLLDSTPRVRVLPGELPFESTAHIMELGKDLGSPRGDIMEAVVWEKGVKVVDGRLYLMIAVHQESIVVPENIDCIRALTTSIPADESIAKTNTTLGLP